MFSIFTPFLRHFSKDQQQIGDSLIAYFLFRCIVDTSCDIQNESGSNVIVPIIELKKK